MKTKQLMFALCAFVVGSLIAFVVLELALRLLPVRETFETADVTADRPYIHYSPNRSVTFSIGWNFSTIVEKRSNNYRYLSSIDYDPALRSPLAVVIGDSYVEAAQVDHPHSMHELLANSALGRGRVYGIGMSGAPLSQYLAFAEFARTEFRPDAVAIVVVGNDFDESLRKYAYRPGHFQFTKCTDQGVNWELTPKPPDPWYVNLLKRSALVRYALLNAGLNQAISRIRYRGEVDGIQNAFVGNVAASYTPERLADSVCVIEAFLALLPDKTGLPPERIVLVLDGMRPQLYSSTGLADVNGSYFDRMRQLFSRRAAELGFEVVDMQPVFIDDFSRHQALFDVLEDGHWNEHAHQLVAHALARARAFEPILRMTP